MPLEVTLLERVVRRADRESEARVGVEALSTATGLES